MGHAAARRSPRLPSCSKQIRFGLMSPSEIINTGELHVCDRNLYKVRQGAGGGVGVGVVARRRPHASSEATRCQLASPASNRASSLC